jgi:hypothetical protein
MVPLFFTFLDGAFRYDCAACGQACCRGKGIALDAARELRPLLRRAPALLPFVEPLAGGYVRLPDVTDGCWFLRSDGLCAYEQDHGRAAKFTTCRLFPFNRVFRAGAVRVVDVNSVVCPVQDALGSGNGVTHAELRAELDAAGEGPLTANSSELPEGARELRWHALEQALLTESAQYVDAADYLGFAAVQQASTRQHLGEPRHSPAEDAEEMRQLVEHYTALYPSTGEAAAVAPATTRALVLLTSSLRWNALFRRGAGPYRVSVRALPRQLLATWFLAVRAALATGRPPSLRALTELHQAQATQRALLARLGEPALLSELAPAADAPVEVQKALQRLRKELQAGHKASLGTHLQRLAQELPTEQRAWLIPLLCRAGDALRFETA